MWPFSKKEKDEAEVVKKEVIGHFLMELSPIFYFDDGDYTRLSEKEAKRFILKHHSKWHGEVDYKPELRDCDDFAKQAASDMVDGQIKERFKAPFLFGSVYITEKAGTRHVLNMTQLKDGRFMFYEANGRKFSFSLPDGAVVERVQF